MIRRTLFIASLFLLASLSLNASKPKANTPVKIVDEGTFAIFQNGQRVATETFTIRQFAESSVTSCELNLDAGQPGGTLQQSSELTLLPDGSLSRYEWKQSSPSHNSATVEPKDDFLTMHIVSDDKASDIPFFLTPTAFVLDDYFFATREVLLWRYLATSCKQRSTGEGCDYIRARFPVIIPRRRTSSEVFIEFKGYDDLPFNGRPQHLRHFLMQTDGPDWNLWLDSNYKLLRISIPDANTEVLRQEK
jgi:hypothetical protein